jgi:hypothetical protein
VAIAEVGQRQEALDRTDAAADDDDLARLDRRRA